MIALVLTALLGAGASAAPVVEDCADCGLERGRARLCAPHRDAQTAVLKEVQTARKSDDAAERIAAVKKAGALSLLHENAPSEKAAEAIGAFLLDDSLDVRRAALAELHPGQHASATLKALGRALEHAEEDSAFLDSKLRAPKSGRMENWSKADLDLVAGLDAYLLELLDTLRAIPDDRSVEHVSVLLARPVDEVSFPSWERAHEVLLTLGTADAVAASVKAFQDVERKLRKGPIQGIGGSFSDGSDPAGGAATMAKALRAAHHPPGVESLERVHFLLEAFAAERGLPAGPAWTGDPKEAAAGWKAWQKHARDLPGLGEPGDPALRRGGETAAGDPVGD